MSAAGVGDARAGRGPFGRALLEHHRGGPGGPDDALRLHSDLGEVDELPTRFFFRDEVELGRLERIALEACRGRVLDVGGGAGVHALLLQERGHPVTSIDVIPEAVEVMEERGVEDARRADVFEFRGGPYDTILMLLNGIGIAGTVSGLDRFLETAPRLLAPGGQLLLDSADLRPRVGGDRREDGRYAGEVHLQLEYRGEKGPPYPQLYVDPETLARRAGPRGWRVEVLAGGEAGEYLARLTRNGPDDGPNAADAAWNREETMGKRPESPRVTGLSWGRVDVEGRDDPHKDAKLFPGGSREWDWNETGTSHRPGIQPADVEELLEAGAEEIVLSRGMNGRLQVKEETLEWLDDRGVPVHVERTENAVALYNELRERKAVGGLIHSTC